MGQKKYIEMLMGAVKPSKEQGNYLICKSDTSFSLKTVNGQKNWNGDVFYSTNSVDWFLWNGSSVFSEQNILYLRGINNTAICKGFENNAFAFIGATALRVLGNIQSLVDYTKMEVGEVSVLTDSAFTSLFQNNTSLIEIPDFPYTKTTANCYYRTFYNTGVKISPSASGAYTKPFRLPTQGTLEVYSGGWNTQMFSSLSPKANTTYYLDIT